MNVRLLGSSPVRLLPIAVAAVPFLLALVPMVFIGHGDLALSTFLSDPDFLVGAARSFALALTASIIGLWLFVAVAAARHGSSRQITAFDFVLLAPMLIGEGAIGFTAKEIINFHLPQITAASSAAFYYALLAFLYAIILGQFLLVAIMLSQRSDIARLLPYSRTHRMTPIESMSLVESPSWSSVLQLYLLLAAILVAYQSAVSQYIFKPGPGQMNELWPHVLSRWVRSFSAIDLGAAVETTGIATLLVSACSLIFLLVALPIIRLAVRSELSLLKNVPLFAMRAASLAFRCLCVALLVAVVWIGIEGSASQPDLGAWFGQTLGGGILATLVLTGLASALLCAASTVIATTVYAHLVRTGENAASWTVVLPLIAGLLVPRIGVGNGALALKLLLFADSDSTLLIPAAWVMAHLVANLPLATAFLLATFARMPQSAWRYYQMSGMTTLEFVRLVLWPAFRGDYLFLYLFLGLIIWTDYPIGRAFSEALPSLPVLLDAASESRAASNGLASFIMLLTTGLAATALWLFGMRILRVTKP